MPKTKTDEEYAEEIVKSIESAGLDEFMHVARTCMAEGRTRERQQAGTGLERIKAPIGQLVNFIEWMADQPCQGNASGQLCRINAPHDLEWCCSACRAHIIRYGETS